jgi:hypothetical protein
VKVRFVTTYTVKDDTGTTYKEGSVHDLSTPSAWHFINRGAAVQVEAESATLPAAERAVKTTERRGAGKDHDAG